MTIYIFSNNAQTTLAAPIGPTDTIAVLAAGTGELFPAPSAGQAFAMTLSQADNGALYEIVLVTSLVGDIVTMERAQENTMALSWAVGDEAGNYYSAGQARAFLQIAPGTSGFLPAPTDAGTVLSWNGTAFAWIPQGSPGTAPTITSAPTLDQVGPGAPITWEAGTVTGTMPITTSYSLKKNGTVVASPAISGAYTNTVSGDVLIVIQAATSDYGTATPVPSLPMTISATATGISGGQASSAPADGYLGGSAATTPTNGIAGGNA